MKITIRERAPYGHVFHSGSFTVGQSVPVTIGVRSVPGTLKAVEFVEGGWAVDLTIDVPSIEVPELLPDSKLSGFSLVMRPDEDVPPR